MWLLVDAPNLSGNEVKSVAKLKLANLWVSNGTMHPLGVIGEQFGRSTGTNRLYWKPD
jgi:hypothetical protein